MNKENFFNLLDFGSSKIRFSVFDKNKSEKYSQNITVLTDEKFSKHFIELNNIIKKAEKKISFHIEDLILFFDSADLFTIDISFNIRYIQIYIHSFLHILYFNFDLCTW